MSGMFFVSTATAPQVVCNVLLTPHTRQGFILGCMKVLTNTDMISNEWSAPLVKRRQLATCPSPMAVN